MADDQAADKPAGDPLDSLITDAIAQSESAEAAPDAGKEVKAEPAADVKVDATGRLHGAAGKFVPKDKVSAAEAPATGTAEAAPTAPEAKAEPAPQVQPIEPPARWTAEDKAKFAAWPRDVQEAVVDRHKALEADYTRKTQEAADLRRTAEPLLNAVKPFEQYMAALAPQIGRQPHELVSDLLAAEYRLRTGSVQERVAALAQIAGSYGIDLAALARGEVRLPDPATTQLHQTISSLSQRIEQFEQRAHQEQAAQVSLHIKAFANSTDANGQPRYPHFERVKAVMSQLLETGAAETMEDAYAKAMEPINQAVAAELGARQKAEETQRNEALEKARKAAPVKSSGSQPRGSVTGGNLDALIDTAMAQHGLG